MYGTKVQTRENDGKNQKEDGRYQVQVQPYEEGCEGKCESKGNGGDKDGDHEDVHDRNRS